MSLLSSSKNSTESLSPITPVPTFSPEATSLTRYASCNPGLGSRSPRRSQQVSHLFGEVRSIPGVEGQGRGRSGKVVPDDPQQLGGR